MKIGKPLCLLCVSLLSVFCLACDRVYLPDIDLPASAIITYEEVHSALVPESFLNFESEKLGVVFSDYETFSAWYQECLDQFDTEVSSERQAKGKSDFITIYGEYDEIFFVAKALAIIWFWENSSSIQDDIWRVCYQDGTLTVGIKTTIPMGALNEMMIFHQFTIEFDRQGDISSLVIR